MISPSANAFVFGDFSVYHKDWLTYSGGADRPGELCYILSISNDITQMVNIPTRIPNCDSHSSALLDLFISSDASICSTMVFPLLGNSAYVVVSVSMDFPTSSKRDALVHYIAYDYSRADWTVFVIIWEMFHGKISWNLVLLLLVNFVSGFRLEMMCISLISIRSNLTRLDSLQLLLLMP